MSTNDLTRSNIAGALGPLLDQSDEKMRTLIASLDESEMSSQDLLKVQAQMQSIQVTTGLHSTLVKALGDLLKEIVQKTG